MKKNIKKVIDNNQKIVPIVLCGNANGFGIVRSFSAKKIKSIVIDDNKSLAMYSKDVGYIVLDSNDSLINILNDLAAELKATSKEAILFACSDIYLEIVGTQRNLISDRIKPIMPTWEIVENCLNKASLFRIAKSEGISMPETHIIENVHQVERIKNVLRYPVIVKPSITIGFSNVYKKAIMIEGEDDFRKLEIDLVSLGLDNRELLVQEFIPGGEETLYTYTSLSNAKGELLGYSIGHKIRQSPHETGTITSGRVIYVEDIALDGKKLVETMKYCGIANTEFKYDHRDGKYKLIEINPRPGLWNFSSTYSGVNLPYIAYKEYFNVTNEIKEIITSDKEIIWVYDFMDFVKSVCINKNDEEKDFKISLNTWKNSLKGDKVHAIFTIKDIKPWFAFVGGYVKKIVNAVLRK